MSQEPTIPPQTPLSPYSGFEARIQSVGAALQETWRRVLEQIPEADAGPQRLGKTLGVDKVLASRLLNAARAPEPMTVLHRAPGPAPMHRVLKSAAKLGVDAALIEAAEDAVNAFEDLIRHDNGDRSSFEAILSAWVPESRRAFETTRMQAAYRATSQLKGVDISVFAETVIFCPSPDGLYIDIMGVKVVHGLRRLRPGVPVLFSTRGRVDGSKAQQPSNLAGEPADSVAGIVLPEFSSDPVPEFDTQIVESSTHYLLKNNGFGSSHAVDLVSCEVIRSAISRYQKPGLVGQSTASSVIQMPSQTMHYDLLIHEDLFPGQTPDLFIYDGAVRGPANPINRLRDIDRMDLLVNLEKLGMGLQRFASPIVPRYHQLLTHVFGELGIDADRLRGFRVTCDYPMYGSQFTMSFNTPDPPPGITL